MKQQNFSITACIPSSPALHRLPPSQSNDMAVAPVIMYYGYFPKNDTEKTVEQVWGIIYSNVGTFATNYGLKLCLWSLFHSSS